MGAFLDTLVGRLVAALSMVVVGVVGGSEFRTGKFTDRDARRMELRLEEHSEQRHVLQQKEIDLNTEYRRKHEVEADEWKFKIVTCENSLVELRRRIEALERKDD